MNSNKAKHGSPKPTNNAGLTNEDLNGFSIELVPIFAMQTPRMPSLSRCFLLSSQSPCLMEIF